MIVAGFAGTPTCTKRSGCGYGSRVALSLARDDVDRFNFQTADVRPHPHGAISPESCTHIVPRKKEGAGKAGCLSAPAALRAKNKKHASKSPQVRRNTRPSLREWS